MEPGKSNASICLENLHNLSSYLFKEPMLSVISVTIGHIIS